MLIDWTSEFNGWLDKVEGAAESGDALAQRKLDYVTAELQVLAELEGTPDHESATPMRVRQARKYPIWRVSTLMTPTSQRGWSCGSRTTSTPSSWRSPGTKHASGNGVYLSAGSRADAAIDQWRREVERDDKS